MVTLRRTLRHPPRSVPQPHRSFLLKYTLMLPLILIDWLQRMSLMHPCNVVSVPAPLIVVLAFSLVLVSVVALLSHWFPQTTTTRSGVPLLPTPGVTIYRSDGVEVKAPLQKHSQVGVLSGRLMPVVWVPAQPWLRRVVSLE